MEFSYKKQNNAGFTLIELIVVASVFLLVAGTATALFISAIQNQKRILVEQESLSQLSYTLEYMSKALRMAKTDITRECLNQDPEELKYYNYQFTRLYNGKYFGIKFVNQSDNDACIEFYLDNSDPDNLVLKEIKNGGAPVDFTSLNLKINQAEFRINGINNNDAGFLGSFLGDVIQPKVTIFLDVVMQAGTSQISKKIQTTVSQRNLNSQ